MFLHRTAQHIQELRSNEKLSAFSKDSTFHGVQYRGRADRTACNVFPDEITSEDDNTRVSVIVVRSADYSKQYVADATKLLRLFASKKSTSHQHWIIDYHWFLTMIVRGQMFEKNLESLKSCLPLPFYEPIIDNDLWNIMPLSQLLAVSQLNPEKNIQARQRFFQFKDKTENYRPASYKKWIAQGPLVFDKILLNMVHDVVADSTTMTPDRLPARYNLLPLRLIHCENIKHIKFTPHLLSTREIKFKCNECNAEVTFNQCIWIDSIKYYIDRMIKVQTHAKNLRPEDDLKTLLSDAPLAHTQFVTSEDFLLASLAYLCFQNGMPFSPNSWPENNAKSIYIFVDPQGEMINGNHAAPRSLSELNASGFKDFKLKVRSQNAVMLEFVRSSLRLSACSKFFISNRIIEEIMFSTSEDRYFNIFSAFLRRLKMNNLESTLAKYPEEYLSYYHVLYFLQLSLGCTNDEIQMKNLCNYEMKIYNALSPVLVMLLAVYMELKPETLRSVSAPNVVAKTLNLCLQGMFDVEKDVPEPPPIHREESVSCLNCIIHPQTGIQRQFHLDAAGKYGIKNVKPGYFEAGKLGCDNKPPQIATSLPLESGDLATAMIRAVKRKYLHVQNMLFENTEEWKTLTTLLDLAVSVADKAVMMFPKVQQHSDTSLRLFQKVTTAGEFMQTLDQNAAPCFWGYIRRAQNLAYPQKAVMDHFKYPQRYFLGTCLGRLGVHEVKNNNTSDRCIAEIANLTSATFHQSLTSLLQFSKNPKYSVPKCDTCLCSCCPFSKVTLGTFMSQIEPGKYSDSNAVEEGAVKRLEPMKEKRIVFGQTGYEKQSCLLAISMRDGTPIHQTGHPNNPVKVAKLRHDNKERTVDITQPAVGDIEDCAQGLTRNMGSNATQSMFNNSSHLKE